MFHRLNCYKLRSHSVAFSSLLLDALLPKTYLKGSAHADPVFSSSSSLVSTQFTFYLPRFRDIQAAPTSWWRRFIWNIDVIIILQTTEQPHTVVKSLSVKHRSCRQLCLREEEAPGTHCQRGLFQRVTGSHFNNKMLTGRAKSEFFLFQINTWIDVMLLALECLLLVPLALLL